jgi:hypothetical protein
MHLHECEMFSLWFVGSLASRTSALVSRTRWIRSLSLYLSSYLSLSLSLSLFFQLFSPPGALLSLENILASLTQLVSPFLPPGFALTALSSDAPQGCMIAKIKPGLSADRAGLRERDVVTHIDGAPTADKQSFTSAFSKIAVGDVVTFTVLRSTVVASTAPASSSPTPGAASAAAAGGGGAAPASTTTTTPTTTVTMTLHVKVAFQSNIGSFEHALEVRRRAAAANLPPGSPSLPFSPDEVEAAAQRLGLR